MEKGLSASQRDQVFLKMAKDELIVKQNMVNQITAANQESNKAFERMSASIESVGKSIGDGLKLLAGAIGANHHPQPYSQDFFYPQHQPYTTGHRQNTQFTPPSVSSSFSGAPQSECTNSSDSNKHYETLYYRYTRRTNI
jgi:hypothetical protein